MANIHKNFPTLFAEAPEEIGSSEEFEKELNQNSGDFEQFGIIPYVLKFCEVTNHTLTETLEMDVNTVFYIVSYEILKIKKQEKEIKRM